MDSDKILTELATLKEQGRWQAQQNHEMRVDLKEIKSDLKNLNAFKFKVIGAVVLAVTIIEVARASRG
jgi:hypothetical protein